MEYENSYKLPSFLIEMLENQYGEENCKIIQEGYTYKRPVTFRVNTIKTDALNIENILKNAKIEYDRVSWSKEVFILKNINEKQIRELDIYKDGKIYLQSLSSMLPPIILNPQENKDILDMAAAPGGKTTQLAAITQNNAHITACERNPIRAERLKYNIEKQGAKSVYCMVKDSRDIDDFFSFDNILLDSPCSGSGTLSIYDKKLESKFTKKLIDKCIITQNKLLNKAIKILKRGQEMVYSTCSILECENENIINNFLKEGKIEIVPIDNEIIKNLPLLSSKIEGTICVMPNQLYEGFFIAKIRKK